MRVTGLVLAAGGSRRLGRPKQLLPYRGTTLLGATLARASGLGLDQLLVTVGGAAEDVLDQVDLAGAEVVVNRAFTTGCSSSIAVSVDRVDPGSAGVLLLLGDQPEVPAAAVEALLAAVAAAPGGPEAAMGACRYTDGVGHPFWLGRDGFEELRGLHGDKGVWRLLDARPDAVLVDVAVPVPRDVDTWDDYTALVDAAPAELPR
ncbi:nucleotidyltransferase family protein [Aquipuribacter sp. MA13-6]|uniref:nucleotidyltransferase family protein n=1 Tax=unclassified Aquipuribacter TaxID=2635084 RepID=UPI003EEABF0C